MGRWDKDGVFIPDYILIPTIILMDEELEPNDFLTYGAVYWYYKLNDNTNDQICKASNERIGKIVGLKGGAIANSLTKLEKLGYIERIFKDEARKHRKEIVPLVVFTKVPRFTEGLNQIHERVNLDSRKGEQKERRKENKKEDTADAFASSRDLRGGDIKIGENSGPSLEVAVPGKEITISLAGGRRVADRPYPIDTPIRKLICAFKEITGFSPTDREWDAGQWSRTAKFAHQLLAFMGGDHVEAIICCEDIHRKMMKLGYLCTMQTVLNHSADWKIKRRNPKDENSY